MCGIAGIVDLGREAVALREILAMSRAIRHRGPDDAGFAFIDQNQRRIRAFSDASSPGSVRNRIPVLDTDANVQASNIALAHRRFSIIDLSDGGHQPYIDKEESCCLTFNGEIYNYIELRDELEAEGVIFRTRSDTEVLLESYKAWGTECFAKLVGFWALALYDRRSNQLILSRDRLGKRPLYWAKIGSRIWFASEIKALLQVPQLAALKKVNEQAVWSWCTLGQRDLGSSTFFS
ncbi:MAG TPA: asparagine synthetase B, partial [Gammaproteobacteria bacterium]|nr:asparagine synthetase B [Gammaproteobacteria bacterium]